jgi:hypothetical protein
VVIGAGAGGAAPHPAAFEADRAEEVASHAVLGGGCREGGGARTAAGDEALVRGRGRDADEGEASAAAPLSRGLVTGAMAAGLCARTRAAKTRQTVCRTQTFGST